MNFHKTRAGLIHFRTDHARNPALFHRASTAVSQLEHLQNPTSPRHEQRLRDGLALTTAEIEKARADGGRYLPANRRTRPYRKSR